MLGSEDETHFELRTGLSTEFKIGDVFRINGLQPAQHEKFKSLHCINCFFVKGCRLFVGYLL